ncbi:MAG: hypothetical protein OXC62_05155 [Aestuariivita sp.]|nr:hypothetical protein [Aestuariivita sp.]
MKDPRYGYCYLFNAICPSTGITADHLCDHANTMEMTNHLVDTSHDAQDGRHALVVMDGAGWHQSKGFFSREGFNTPSFTL